MLEILLHVTRRTAQEHVRMFKTYGTSVNTRWGAACPPHFQCFCLVRLVVCHIDVPS
jgi:hypothetical protein